MKKLKLIFVITFLLAGINVLHAEPAQPKAILQEANTAYEKGNFDSSLELYTQLVRQGFEGLALYYNLGNVYYRRGERGPAVLWYERALHLSPRDSDVKFNLTLARTHLKDELQPLGLKILNFFSLKELTLAFSVVSFLFFVTLGLKVLKLVRSELWPLLMLWSCGFFMVVVTAWLGTALYWNAKPYAIVMQPPGEVRNGPGVDYAVGFTIPEGSKVLILNDRPDWVQVGVPQQGLKGWMPSKDIEKIQLPPIS